MEKEEIRALCRQYTDLTDEEITELLNMSSLLQPMADIEEADMFIDCPMIGGDALVIAEAKPTKVPSSYKTAVAGMFAKQENEPAVARTFRLGIGTRQMKATTQENGVTIQTVEPIRRGERVIGVLIREKRTNEDIQLNEKFHLSGKGYEAIASSLSRISPENNWLTECIDEALLLVNRKGVIVFSNSLARKLYQKVGYVEDIIGQPYANVQLEMTGDGSKPADRDYSYEEAAVGNRVLSIKRVPLDSEDISFAVLMRDITKQKEQEKELVLKSVAIREMHHRIKNSLQTVASLLRIQIRRSDSPEVREVLSESMTRLLSIANTHQLLAHEVADDVMLGEVLKNLRETALRAYIPQNYTVSITIEGDDFKVDSDTATSVALVVNELLQNALKYAFHEGDDGHVRILVTRGALYSQIIVEDDGEGFRADDPDSAHLGISIVRTMVKDKLQGDIDIRSDSRGTRIRFHFLNRLMKPVE